MKNKLLRVPSDRAKPCESGLLIPVGGDLLLLKGKWLCVSKTEEQKKLTAPSSVPPTPLANIINCGYCFKNITGLTQFGHPQESNNKIYCETCFNKISNINSKNVIIEPKKPSEITIKYARYGYQLQSACEWVDVTKKLQSYVKGERLNIVVSEKNLGHLDSGVVVKSLVVIYEMEMHGVSSTRKVTIHNGAMLTLDRNNTFGRVLPNDDKEIVSIEIEEALYGAVGVYQNVTSTVQRHFLRFDKPFNVSAESLMCTDLAKHIGNLAKTLTLTYWHNSIRIIKTFSDGEDIVFGKVPEKWTSLAIARAQAILAKKASNK